MIDRLCDQAKEEDIVVACLYYDFLAQQEQTITSVIGAILKQVVSRGGISKNIRESFLEAKREVGGRGPRLADLMGMLRIAIASLPQVFICVDALDECLPKYLPEFLEFLGDIVRESPRTRIFLTGRPHVGDDIQRYFPKPVMIPISPKPEDIRNYLEMRLERDAESQAMSSDLRADVVRIILERISDTCVRAFRTYSSNDIYLPAIACRFLLVSLNIDAILGEMTIRQRRKKLEEITRGNGLGDAYTATLTRLQAQEGNKAVLGLKVLMWVLYSERPLRGEELCHALGVEIGAANLDPENVPPLRTLLSSCLGLVTVEASSFTVRLVHFTLQEHLARDPTLFHSPHSTIAEVCLTYLNFGYVCDLSPILYSPPSRAPFLEYSSLYWGEHTRRGMTESVKTLALRLLDRFDKHISAQLLLLHYNEDRGSGPYFDRVEGPTGFTGLHGVAFLGIVEILAVVLEMREWDVNAVDCTGSTALTWAARKGYEVVVEMLLGREGVNPDKADTQYGQTPLSWAAECGHEGVVMMLLEREDVNPDQEDTRSGQTPLSWAAKCGHEGIVKMLLEREDVNPNTLENRYGFTPLSWAAERGNEGVVRILLERKDVNPDQADTKSGRTPLSCAAGDGNEGIVKMLLEREDVNPNTVDSRYGGTPLSWAAWRGQTGVVKILLEREGVNPDQADTKSGRTPLSWAAESGCEGIVKMLLERADVNPDQEDIEGRTPLSRAAELGYEGVVKMLLERENVNPNRTDAKFGGTPLSWATERGHEGVVRVLLERADADPDQADTKSGRTPLSWAAECGHEVIVRMFLERADVNPDTVENEYGCTPLLWAAEKGHEGIVKMLLERLDVNPNQADTDAGRTPLSWAAEYGHEVIAKMLLERADVDPDMVGNEYGCTSLFLAVKNGYEEVVKMLLERADVNPNTVENKYGCTPLSWAAWRGKAAVVKMLLERRDVDPNTADRKYGRTPLAWAALRGHQGIVKMLLERRDVRTAIQDNKHQTPISLALSKKHSGVVKILLEGGNANSDATNSSG